MFLMIESLGSNRRSLISQLNMNRRERVSKIFRSSCNKLRLKLREKWLFTGRNTKTLSKHRKISSTDWRMRSRSLRKKMSNSMKFFQLASQEQERNLNNGKSNSMKLIDNILSFKLSLKRIKLFG